MIRNVTSILFLFTLLLSGYQSMAKKWTFNTSASNIWIPTDIAVQQNGAAGPHLGDTIVWHRVGGAGDHNVTHVGSAASPAWSTFGPLQLDTSHQDQMFIPTNEGQHAFTCTFHPQTMNSFFWMNSKLSVGNFLEDAGIVINPNPASTILTIKSKMQNPSINITNVIGKNVGTFEGVETTNGTTINVANIPSGTYFLTLSSKEMVLTRRIIIAH